MGAIILFNKTAADSCSSEEHTACLFRWQNFNFSCGNALVPNHQPISITYFMLISVLSRSRLWDDGCCAFSFPDREQTAMHLTFGQINEYQCQIGRAKSLKTFPYLRLVGVCVFFFFFSVHLCRLQLNVPTKCIIILKCHTIEMYADESGRH